MLSLPNLIWTLIILCLPHCNVFCLTLSRPNLVNLPSILPGSVTFQTQKHQQQQQQQQHHQLQPQQQHDNNNQPIQLSDETGQVFYDAGDDLSNMFNADETNDGLVDNYDIQINNFDDRNNFIRKLEEDFRDDQEILSKSEILMKFLEDPNADTLPIIYVEKPQTTPDGSSNELLSNGLSKRSRYYRRYPWKRHNRSRGNYEPDARFLCVPSKDDVLKLLVGLHQNRNGNHHKTVTFCNRKRPAKAIFTNIRFLG